MSSCTDKLIEAGFSKHHVLCEASTPTGRVYICKKDEKYFVVTIGGYPHSDNRTWWDPADVKSYESAESILMDLGNVFNLTS